MKIIVNVNEDWAIGNKGALINPFSEDLKRFKRLTNGNPIIYGRKTLSSFPGSKPLVGRTNIVITSNFANIESKFEDSVDNFCLVNELNRIGSKYINVNSFTKEPTDYKDIAYTGTSLFAVHSIMSAIDTANLVGTLNNTFVCGGDSVYTQMLKYCDEVYVTMVYKKDQDADAFFPCLDISNEWKIDDRDGKTFSESGVPYEFRHYCRV